MSVEVLKCGLRPGRGVDWMRSKVTEMLKRKQDKFAAIVMVLLGSLIALMVCLGLHIPVLPLFVVVLLVCAWIATRPGDGSISTNIVNGAGSTRSATVHFQEDKLLVTSPGQVVEIPFEQVTQLLTEDCTKGGLDMTGWSIDYQTAHSANRVMFLETGVLSASRTKRFLSQIQSAHSKHYAGTQVDPLIVGDLTAARNARLESVVHSAR